MNGRPTPNVWVVLIGTCVLAGAFVSHVLSEARADELELRVAQLEHMVGDYKIDFDDGAKHRSYMRIHPHAHGATLELSGAREAGDPSALIEIGAYDDESGYLLLKNMNSEELRLSPRNGVTWQDAQGHRKVLFDPVISGVQLVAPAPPASTPPAPASPAPAPPPKPPVQPRDQAFLSTRVLAQTGPFCHITFYLRNLDKNQGIKVTVKRWEVDWTNSPRGQPTTKVYTLAPGEEINTGCKESGQSGPSRVTGYEEIVGAEWK